MRPLSFRKKSRRVSNAPKNKKKFLNGTMGFFVLAAVISYLIQTNSVVTKGYQIKDLEQKIADLRQTKKDLESKTLELQSMTTLSSKVEKLNLVKVEKAKYLSADQATVRR